MAWDLGDWQACPIGGQTGLKMLPRRATRSCRSNSACRRNVPANHRFPEYRVKAPVSRDRQLSRKENIAASYL